MTTPDATSPPLPSAEELASALSSFKQTFGAVTIGSWFMTALYGIAVAQTYYYFHTYKDDPLWLKGLVSLLWSLNTLHTMITCYVIYHYVISSAFDMDAVATNNWSLSASVAIHICVTCFFFAYFIWLAFKLSKKKYQYWVAIGLAVPALAHIALGFVTAARMHQAVLLTDYESFSNTVMVPMATTQVFSDMLLSLALCILLKQQQTAFKRSNNIITTLIVFAVGRGLLTSALAFVELIASVSPSSLWYGAIEFMVAGLYTNSLLVTLNARRRIRGTGSDANQASFPVPLSNLSSEGRSFSTDSTPAARSFAISHLKKTEIPKVSQDGIIDIIPHSKNDGDMSNV